MRKSLSTLERKRLRGKREKMKNRELTDDELELVIGGQTYNQFQEWRVKVVNEYRENLPKKSQDIIKDIETGVRNVRWDYPRGI